MEYMEFLDENIVDDFELFLEIFLRSLYMVLIDTFRNSSETLKISRCNKLFYFLKLIKKIASYFLQNSFNPHSEPKNAKQKTALKSLQIRSNFVANRSKIHANLVCTKDDKKHKRRRFA